MSEARSASGASVASVDAAAFDLAATGEPNGAAALCLHGLTGTPYEVRPLGAALAARGFRAVGPCLPGHDASAAELAEVPQTAWVEAARACFRRLSQEHAGVVVTGLSMGGLVALLLAAEEPVRALAVVGTPLRFRAPLPLLIPLLKHVKPFLAKRDGSDIRDPAAKARHLGMKQMPLASVHELIRLQARVEAALPRITAPILVAHGRHDHTVNPADAEEIASRVASEQSEVLYLEQSGHVATVDYDGEKLATAVATFLASGVAE